MQIFVIQVAICRRFVWQSPLKLNFLAIGEKPDSGYVAHY